MAGTNVTTPVGIKTEKQRGMGFWNVTLHHAGGAVLVVGFISQLAPNCYTFLCADDRFLHEDGELFPTVANTVATLTRYIA